MLTTSPDTGADNWWLAIGWWQLVAVCWWQLLGDKWLVAIGGWQLVGDNWLVELVGGSWLVAILVTIGWWQFGL